jgi:hypothetical protein
MSNSKLTQGFDELFTVGQWVEIPIGEMPTYDMTADSYIKSPPKNDGSVVWVRVVKVTKNSIELETVRKRKKRKDLRSWHITM